MQRVARQDWIKRVKRWADSGLTAKEFANEIGCNPQTLQFWKYLLARERREGARPKPQRPRTSHARRVEPEIAFVEVAAPVVPSSRIEVELRGGAVRLLVPCDADPAAVARLVDALAVAA